MNLLRVPIFVMTFIIILQSFGMLFVGIANARDAVPIISPKEARLGCAKKCVQLPEKQSYYDCLKMSNGGTGALDACAKADGLRVTRCKTHCGCELVGRGKGNDESTYWSC